MSSFALPSSAPPSHLTSPKIKWFNLTRLQTGKFEFVVTTGAPCATFPAKNFVLGPAPFKDRCNRSFFYYFISLLFFYYLKTLYFTLTYKWKKKKKNCKKITKLQDYSFVQKKISLRLYIKKTFRMLIVVQSWSPPRLVKFPLKSCLLCLRSWLNFILLRLPSKERP